MTKTLQEIDVAIRNDSHWKCNLQFNEEENKEAEHKYIDFSSIMESNNLYFFPSHYNGIQNLNKMVLALRVMCIKAGFYLVHRSTKSPKQLAIGDAAYITLCCQHSLMHCKSKKDYVRSTFTKLCTDPTKRCFFSINIALCKQTNRWYLKSSRNSKNKERTLHIGHMKLLPAHISCSITMLNDEDKDLILQCNQVTINAAKIANLISLRNKYGTNTEQIRYGHEIRSTMYKKKLIPCPN